MVLPRDGLHDAEGKSIKYDRAYYIGEQDFMYRGILRAHTSVMIPLPNQWAKRSR